MLVYVTGATGYLGRWVCHHLNAHGHHVLEAGSRHPAHYQYHEYLHEVDAVVHLGWYTSGNHTELHQYCLDNTVQLLESTKQCSKVPRFVFASTAGVYGDTGTEVVAEEHSCLPKCPYSTFKLMAEGAVRQANPFNHTTLRIGSLMGLGLGRTKTDLIVNAMAMSAWHKKQIELWHPNAWKPVIHVRDAAETIRIAVEAKESWGTVNCCALGLPSEELAGIVGRATRAMVKVVENNSSTISVRMCTRKLYKKVGFLNYRTVTAAVEELREYKETELDKATPWRIK